MKIPMYRRLPDRIILSPADGKPTAAPANSGAHGAPANSSAHGAPASRRHLFDEQASRYSFLADLDYYLSLFALPGLDQKSRSCPPASWAVLAVLSMSQCNVVVQAAQSGVLTPSPPSPSAQRAVRTVVGADTTLSKPDTELSADADEVAILTEILPLYERLKTEQQTAHTTTTTDTIRQNQRIIYLHAKINQYLHASSLEVASVSGRLNAGMAQLADRKAIISDQRAQLLRKNTTINLISGGLTKIGGYSTALVPNVSAIPTNVLEVFDGTVQVGLSAVNMKAQSSERDFYKSKPAILQSFLSNANDENGFPKSVWLYLTTPTSSGKTRREMLIAQWRATGRLTGRRRSQPSVASMKMDDLDDMVAMMSDIKSVVSGMEVGLMKLSEVLKQSYQHDPEI